MNIGIIMFRHGANRKSPIMPEVIRLLAEWDAMIEVIYPEERTIDLGAVRPDHDLYVLKSGSELALSLAGALHAAGAKIVNPYPVAAMMRDKIVSTRVLSRTATRMPSWR